LLAFLFSLSALNAGESFAADNAKEIKIEDVRKKVEALSFRSISSLLDNVYLTPVVLEKNKSKLMNHYENTVLPIEKDIYIYKSTKNPSLEIRSLEKRYESYSGIIKEMIKYSIMTDEDAKILNNGINNDIEIDKKHDPSKFKSKHRKTSEWSLDNNNPVINLNIENELMVSRKLNQAAQRFVNWPNIATDMNEYSEKYQEGWVDKVGKMARKIPIGNAFGNTKDATEKYIQAYDKGIMDELNYYNDPNIKSDPDAFNNAMEAMPEAVQSARDAAIEAGRTIPGTIGNPPLKKIPYPLP
jgi:hypothetical protein